MKTFSRLLLLALLAFSLMALASCSSDDEQSNDDSECVVGEAGCACFANDTCLEGFSCVEGVCVDPDAPSDAGFEDAGHGDVEDYVSDCVDLSPLRLWKTNQSVIAMLFTAEDCDDGQALTGLGESAFSITEGGESLSSDAATRVLPSDGLRVYVTILIDMSSATAPVLEELQLGARRFVDELLVEQGLSNVYIGIEAFDGSATTITVEDPTNDAGRLEAQIDALSEFSGTSASSANLYGASRQAVENLQDHQERIMDRNFGGVATTGHLLLFTDGGDTAQREDVGPARDTIASARTFDAAGGAEPTVRTIAVGLGGDDYDPDALAELVGGPEWVTESAPAELGATSERIGREMGRRINGTYLLAYCSASRDGDHSAQLEMADASSNAISFEFNADAFGDGCSAVFFETVCDHRACGGFSCGACDDATESCDGAGTGRCVDDCVEQDLCSGEEITNDLGYQRICDFGDEIGHCAGQCIDLVANDSHCGACDNACTADSSQCVGGECACDGGGIECAGTCVDNMSDSDHCGQCDNVCPQGTSCVDGLCDCGGGEVACGGTCTDLSSDTQNCGECGEVCEDEGSVCDSGDCVCPVGGMACDGACVDATTDMENCGGCGVVCDDEGSVCDSGDCVCPDGGTACNGACVDTAADMENCGVCGVVCEDQGSVCESGNCICPDGETACDGACVDTATHTHHCGGCNISCNFDEQCDAGSCVRAVQVSAGGFHTCGVKIDDTVDCWGWDGWDQLALPAGKFAQVSAGDRHTCGVRTDDTVDCWGRDTDGQSTPPSGTFAELGAGHSHTCGVRTDDTVDCWGLDDDGQSTPPSGTFVQVSAGLGHTCGVKTDGTVICWGRDNVGQSTSPSGAFTHVSAGNNHTCGVKADGPVACWGSNGDGQSTPPSGTFTHVSAGDAYTCGIRTDSTVECWGSNDHGQLTPPSGMFSHVSAGGWHTCGVRTDDTVVCWGSDGHGQSTPPPGW